MQIGVFFYNQHQQSYRQSDLNELSNEKVRRIRRSSFLPHARQAQRKQEVRKYAYPPAHSRRYGALPPKEPARRYDRDDGRRDLQKDRCKHSLLIRESNPLHIASHLPFLALLA